MNVTTVSAAPIQASEPPRSETTAPATDPKPAAAETKPGAQGIQKLSGDAAAVVLTEQGKAPDTPPPPKLDLHGQDLRSTDLSKLDLRGADLSGADLTGKDLTGVDFSGATLSGAKFDGATFSKSNLHGVTAIGASFTKANFDETDLNEANFTDAKFTGAVFDHTWEKPLEKEGNRRGYFIEKSDFTNSDFRNVTFKYGAGFNANTFKCASFEAVTATCIEFEGGSLEGTNFRGANTSIGASNTNASGADFSNINGSNNHYIILELCQVDKATFKNTSARLVLSSLDLRSVDLSTKDKSLRYSRVIDCVMTGMDFAGYDFSHSEFMSYGESSFAATPKSSPANYADMTAGTNFKGAIFTGAHFYHFDMRKALLDAGAFSSVHITNYLSKDKFVNSPAYSIEKLFEDSPSM